MTGRFLFSTLSGFGHVHPLIPLARALRDANHQVAFAARERARALIEQAAFDFFPIGEPYDSDPEYQQFRIERDSRPVDFEGERFIYTKLFCGITPRLNLPGLVEVAKKWQPDMFIREGGEYGAVLAAELLGIPHATVSYTTALRGMSIFESDTAAQLDPLRKTYGLAPDPNLEALYRYLYLAYAPATFATHEVGIPTSFKTLPRTTHFVRPQIFDNPTAEQLPEWFAHLPPQPTIYITLGTEVNSEPTLYPRVMQTILDGLRDAPYNLIVTLGRDKNPSDFGAQPPNVHIERYIPQSLLLPHCDLFVMHGGSNSILAALNVGLPLVIIPLIADQFFNAHIVAEQKLGRAIQLDALTPDTIRAEVDQVLRAEPYRQNMTHLQNEMYALPDQSHALELLERVATTRAPVLNPMLS